MSSLLQLGRPALESLAQALETQPTEGRFSTSRVRHHVPTALVGPVYAELKEMLDAGMAHPHIARWLRLLAVERGTGQAIADRVELVWSGLDLHRATTRDTGVVVNQLFREAKRSVLVASYAIDIGKKATALFGDLAARMDDDPALDVRLFLNVHRKNFRDETPESVVLREFAERFRGKVWPGERLPAVFYDPRSLAVGGETRACLHAKCIVIDDERALVTSANFTEAAHERNIEAGVVISDATLAKALRTQFETLAERRALMPLPGVQTLGAS